MTVKSLNSRENPLFKDLQRLAGSSRERRARGLALLEGTRLIDAYVRTGGIPEILVAGSSAARNPEFGTLLSKIPAKERVILADPLLDRISQVVTSSGLVAVVKVPPVPPLPDTIGDCLILENIQDPGNLGSIFRSAAAADVRLVLLSQGCVFAWSPKVVRAGMGAHFSLQIHEGVDVPSVLSLVHGQSVATVASADKAISAYDLKGPIAWLFGNEGAGLTKEAASAASTSLRIPMPGQAESLNVAAAAAICLFEQVRQRNLNAPDVRQ